MKKNEIKVGGEYLAKVSDRIVTVRVDAIRNVSVQKRHSNYTGRGSAYSESTVYDVTNLATGRKITFRSAAKFRGPATKATAKKVAKAQIDTAYDQAATATVAHDQREEPTRPFSGSSATQPTTTATASNAADGTESASAVSPSATPTNGSSSSSTSEDPSKYCQDTEPDCCESAAGDEECIGCGKPVRPKPVTSADSVSSNGTPQEHKTAGKVTPATPLGRLLQKALAVTVTKHPPTPEQQAIIDAAKKLGKGDVLVVQAGAGTGKCLGEGTPVLLFDGSIKAVEDVEPGDLLIGPDSEPRTVLTVSSGIGNLYNIVPVKGDSWVCNDEHILTLTGTNRSMGLVRDVAIKDYLKEDDHHNWKLFRVGVRFDGGYNGELPVPPYLVGLWMGDGTRGSANISNSKEEIHTYCERVASDYGLICKIRPDAREHKHTFTISFSSCSKGDKGQVTGGNPFLTFFRDMCSAGEVKRIPQEYLTSTTTFRKELLAGVLDTDGELSACGVSGTSVTVTGEPYRDGLLFLCRSLGLAAYCTSSKMHVAKSGKVSTYYKISISGDLDAIPTKVRKFPTRNQVKRVNVTGFEVEYEGEGHYYGFTLDGDGRFLLGDFTVTHNTSTQVMLETNLVGRGQYTAFNKSLVDESKPKFKVCSVNTTHSLAFRAIGKQYAHRLGGARIKSEQVAQTLGLSGMTVIAGPGLTRSLSASFLASRVLGAVRRFCQSADREISEDHFAYIDGIDLPVNGQRTYANNNAVRERLVPYAERAWKDLSATNGTMPYNPDCYVKVWQLNRPVISADYILLDECFPAGTLVTTDIGEVPIERIAGEPDTRWRILTTLDNGRTLRYSQVTRAYKTPAANSLVEVSHENGKVRCTANHPFWVDGKGWTAAGLLTTGDALPCLWKAGWQEGQNMLSVLRDEMAGLTQGPQSRSRTAEENIQTDEGSSYHDSEPLRESGRQGQNIGYAQATRDQVHSSWRQWERADTSRIADLPRTGSTPASLALEPRLCRLKWSAKTWDAHMLQNRRSITEDEGSGRGGRQVSREEGNSGLQEGRSTFLTRVVSVQILQPDNRGECVEGSNQDNFVYTLATETGSYFADGLLVKNCQDTAPVMLDIIKQQKHALVVLVGDGAQQIYSWRGAVDATEAFPDAPTLYLSQSFRFGSAIAAVANQILEKVGTPLRLRGFDKIDSKVERVKNPTAILTRTNAAAVGLVLQALDDGKKPFLVGGGADVCSFVEGAKQLQAGRGTSHPDLACFANWVEVQQYVKEDDGEDLKLLVKLIDTFGCDEILRGLKGMPKEKDADLVVCTAHKSKGREWDSVRLAQDFPTLSKCTDADFKLLYVAATRAKLILDITECPFFTGEDALNIIPTPAAEKPRDRAPDAGVVPPTPSAPPRPVDGYTWAKGRDGWLIRGPKGNSGKSIEVVKRDGSKQTLTLGRSVWEDANGQAALYEKA